MYPISGGVVLSATIEGGLIDRLGRASKPIVPQSRV